MNRTQHPSNNAVLGAPVDWDQKSIECGALPITRTNYSDGSPVMVSFWTPSKEELADLAAGGSISLWVFGTSHPPVSLQVEPASAQH